MLCCVLLGTVCCLIQTNVIESSYSFVYMLWQDCKRCKSLVYALPLMFAFGEHPLYELIIFVAHLHQQVTWYFNTYYPVEPC